MEGKLYESAVEGSVEKLLELIRQDPLILDRAGASETPLHVAAMVGNTEFVEEILRRRPRLAKELDSTRSSPLHLASAKGYLEIVRSLLREDADMCCAVDGEGRNPLCLAAMNGRLDVLKELVGARPQAARAGAEQGGTILHVCVKNNQLEALKFLVEAINDDQFINRRDDFGFTILHLAVSYKQVETVNFLLTRSVEVNALSNGFTALDILSQSSRDLKDLDISENLRAAGAFRATARPIPTSAPNGQRNAVALTNDDQSVNGKRERKKRLANKKNAIMVVASLIATMAFSAGLTPPGGLWQDNSKAGDRQTHQAGKSILAYENSRYVYFVRSFSDGGFSGYRGYVLFNTIGLLASLSAILLLITEPLKGEFLMWVLTLNMWVGITSMALTYFISLTRVTPDDKMSEVEGVLWRWWLYFWILCMMWVVYQHFLYLITTLFRKLFRVLGRRRRQQNQSFFQFKP